MVKVNVNTLIAAGWEHMTVTKSETRNPAREQPYDVFVRKTNIQDIRTQNKPNGSKDSTRILCNPDLQKMYHPKFPKSEIEMLVEKYLRQAGMIVTNDEPQEKVTKKYLPLEEKNLGSNDKYGHPTQTPDPRPQPTPALTAPVDRRDLPAASESRDAGEMPGAPFGSCADGASSCAERGFQDVETASAVPAGMEIPSETALTAPGSGFQGCGSVGIPGQVEKGADGPSSASLAIASCETALYKPADAPLEAPDGLSTPVSVAPEAPAPVASFADISTLRAMRSDKPSFVLALDSEFRSEYLSTVPEDAAGRDASSCITSRDILSYQFAFIPPYDTETVYEVVFFRREKSPRLPLSLAIPWILETFGIYCSFYPEFEPGFTYFSTRIWRVPVWFGKHLVLKNFSSCAEARSAFASFEPPPGCDLDDSTLQSLRDCYFRFLKVPASHKADLSFDADNVLSPPPISKDLVRIPKGSSRGKDLLVPLGYVNDFSNANKYALDVTLVCHSGRVDLSALNFDNEYETDVLRWLSGIQGGAVSLDSRGLLYHSPLCSAYWKFYPFRLHVRDTMCFADGKHKSLAAIGDSLGIPKLTLPDGYSKDRMDLFLAGDPVSFIEYASRDAVVTLLYSAGLWGTNLSMPTTLSAAAVSACIPVICNHFGISGVDKQSFRRYNELFRGLTFGSNGLVRSEKGGFKKSRMYIPLNDGARVIQDMATEAFIGGLNTCPMPGYYFGRTYDIDLKGAYASSGSLLCDIDWENPIAFEILRQKLTITHFIGGISVPMFAYVSFKFPESVPYPCIPVIVDGVPVFPRTSDGLEGVFACGPELFLALQLGAEIFVHRGYVCNAKFVNGQVSRSLAEVYKSFVCDRDLAKKLFGIGSLEELMVKLCSVSIYGKTGQGVKGKSSFNPRLDSMVKIGPCKITSPALACMTTAIVRAVLLAVSNQLTDLGYHVYSITTDGFITDAPPELVEKLDLYGLAAPYKEARVFLSGSDRMWEAKHTQDELYNLTTRGNVAPADFEGVLARNGYSVDVPAVAGREVSDPSERAAYDRAAYVSLVLSRTGKVSYRKLRFASHREVCRVENRVDFFATEEERSLSMDYDFKRKPLRETFHAVYKDLVSIDDYGNEVTKTYEVASFNTAPFDNVEEFLHWRTVSKSFVSTHRSLRTMDDWNAFFLRVTGAKAHAVDYNWASLMSCILAYRQQVPLDCLQGNCARIPFLDDKSHSVAEKVAWIQSHNRASKSFNINDWKNCRKPERLSQMLPEAEFKALLFQMMDSPT